VDIENSIRLRARAPEEILFVAESGIRTAADVAELRRHGVDAVLVGEALMRARDKRAALAGLMAGAHG
jgi:indole-3-glycerol phosphate synthase